MEYFRKSDNISYHQSVDEAVDEDEHPNGRAHVANTGPHAKHSAGMVIGLQGRAPLALGDNDESVQDLVELAKIEDPAPESQSLIPQPANIGRVWVSVRAHADERILRLPDVDGGVVGDGVAQTSRAVNLAHRVRNAGEPARVVPARPGMHERSEHGDESREAVDGEDDIVEDDEGLEEGLARDPPGLVAAAAVDGVEGEYGEDVGDGEEERHLRAHCQVEEPWRDSEWRAKGALSDGRRKGAGQVGWRELEEVAGRQREVDLRSRHVDVLRCC